ncbi:NDP-sugar epimerase, includes UDP-GlcNAc-inverting 4,6-dehydratase FlaA1 and capsular polysaccharide biosynthesis protein EpsC [Marinobacter mobilis]|uniref:NDP-sugar epimerase, includes UDP-GlcNAc-inverting 4,6-dehydratase FlaA1 and capsular polysaccharide biosynthesis protein EpsC n=2 Tax=Marinobacter mobilis TaxID=488533 RepID=A0A1H3DAM1_9GAMM|nr:NDP-sugar epimerase, includes UDP-GlcNAc-inverting 4,6-dehydratase FlaA1 and capsular polysaccharide biosynthesis protein EpsC [Marinobacter mobilis]
MDATRNRMLQTFLDLPRFYKRVISVAADTVFLALALWVSFALRFENLQWVPDSRQLWVFGGTILVTLAVFVRIGLYRAVIRYISERALFMIISGVAVSAVAFMIFGFLFQAMVPRSVPVIYGALAFILVAGTRFGVRALIQHPGKKLKEFVIIVGAGPRGMQLASALGQGIECRPVAFISMDDAKHRSLINGLPVYSLSHVEKAVKNHGASRVLLALEDASAPRRRNLIERLEKLSVAVQTVPSVAELVTGKARINDVRDLDIEDLLGRAPVPPRRKLVDECLSGKVVMVTGAGGSIGSELCRQIISHRPKALVLLDISEFGLYSIERELSSVSVMGDLRVDIHALLGSVTDRRRCEAIMRTLGVQIVYHAAAYKHVPLVEHNLIEGIRNNVFGTLYSAQAAIAAGIERYVLVSTDKAVRPTNVMGASKRLAELVLQGLSADQSATCFSMVRFGNVLGSSGSVVPLFRDQIRDGGPVTVTHPDIIRYFMTIPEAGQLVLQAGAMGQGGEVFVLDMGEPVKIADLARKMIHLMGLEEFREEDGSGDISIRYTGLRPGEKLYEELLIGNDPRGTAHPRIMMAREASLEWSRLELLLEQMRRAADQFDCGRLVELMLEAPTGYQPNHELEDLIWCRKITDTSQHSGRNPSGQQGGAVIHRLTS